MAISLEDLKQDKTDLELKIMRLISEFEQKYNDVVSVEGLTIKKQTISSCSPEQIVRLKVNLYIE